jgi:hypothetical protein
MYIDAELRIVPPEMCTMSIVRRYHSEGVVQDIFNGPLIKERLMYWGKDSLICEVEKSGIHGGLVSGLAWRDEALNEKNNCYVENFIKETPNFYGCYIAPHGSPDEIVKICSKLEKLIFTVIEFIPKLSDFNFSEEEFSWLISELGCLGFYIKIYTAHPTQKFSGNNVYQTFSLIKKNPNVNFIIPHLGGLLPLYSLNDGYGEIFSKTIFLSSVSSSLDMVPICISVMPKNICFATDFPFNHDCSVLNSLSTCREIVNKKNYENFFYGNINKFMNEIWG